jgi:tetratricopeptide (TPR) repeat protein
MRYSVIQWDKRNETLANKFMLNDCLYRELNQLTTVARLYMKHRKFAKAEEVFASSVKLQERYTGSYSAELALTLYLYSECFCEQGKHRQADRILQQAVDMWQRLKRVGLFNDNHSLLYMDGIRQLRMLATIDDEESNLVESIA